MKRCNKCGKILPETVKFCRQCGNDLSRPENFTLIVQEPYINSEKRTDTDHIGNNYKIVKKCNICGYIAPQRVKFCKYCGSDLSNPENYTLIQQNFVETDNKRVKSNQQSPVTDAKTKNHIHHVKKNKSHAKKYCLIITASAIAAAIVLSVVFSASIRSSFSDLITDVTGKNGENVVDPFDDKVFNVDKYAAGVHILEDGYSPMITVSIQNDSTESPYNQIVYAIDEEGESKTTYYKAGDKITIKALFSNGTDTSDGLVLKTTKKKIKVTGEGKYVTKVSELKDSESLQKLALEIKENTEKSSGKPGDKLSGKNGSVEIDNDIDDSFSVNNPVIDSYEFAGVYLMALSNDNFFKESENLFSFSLYNSLCVIYQINIHSADDGKKYHIYCVDFVGNVFIDNSGKLNYPDGYQFGFNINCSTLKYAKHLFEQYQHYYHVYNAKQHWDW